MLLLLAVALVELVNPFVGTSGYGHTTPAASCPFGMVQPGPDTGNCAWKYCGGYQYDDRTLIGFSQTHLSGTGAADFGDVRILPYIGGDAVPENVAIEKEGERAEPGYYAVKAGGIAVEITATPRCAFYRMKFPKGEVPHIKLDPATGLSASEAVSPRIPVCEVTQTAEREIRGRYRRIGWADRMVYFVLRFDTDIRLVRTGEMWDRLWRIDFDGLVETVNVRIALSARNVEGAARNIDREATGLTFDDARKAASARWEEMLSRIRIGGEGDRRSFYTALYHVCFQPNLISDAGEPDRYSTFSYWDTFRAAHPLYTLLVPELVPAFVESELDQFARSGHLSAWSLWGQDVHCMVGVHSIPPLVDAVLKGLVDSKTSERILAAIEATLCRSHPDCEKENWDVLERYGYYPYDIVCGESTSRTLECAYDFACAERLARRLGRPTLADAFGRKAKMWTSVVDSGTGFARPRLADGSWCEPFDPTDCGTNCGFTEGNAWQYTWHVLHDAEGLITAFGGKGRTIERLERLFGQPIKHGRFWTADISGEIGQYAHGNEPSHHVPYLFTLAGRNDLAAKWIGRICREFYRDAPDGVCGNDDCGQMSAWYVFAQLGFYPVNPCGGEYVIGAPQVPAAQVKVYGEGEQQMFKPILVS